MWSQANGWVSGHLIQGRFSVRAQHGACDAWRAKSRAPPHISNGGLYCAGKMAQARARHRELDARCGLVLLAASCACIACGLQSRGF